MQKNMTLSFTPTVSFTNSNVFRVTPGKEVDVRCNAFYRRPEDGPEKVEFRLRILSADTVFLFCCLFFSSIIHKEFHFIVFSKCNKIILTPS